MVVRQISSASQRGKRAWRLKRASAFATSNVPRLESGDRLTLREFEARYQAMPKVKKAELIEGVVVMPSPVHFAQHGKPHSFINTWLGTYCASTPGVETADNVTVRLDSDNEVQPDALLRLTDGGASRVTPDDFLQGAPELIIEIASTSAAYDLHDKKRVSTRPLVYRRNGVREYLVWQIHEARVDWFALREGDYVARAPDAKGVIRSEMFPGLRLNVAALLAGDVAGVLAELRRGLGSVEHAALVRRVAKAARD
jgi:Uma2 family endonuclease